jgi:hypothetical protein
MVTTMAMRFESFLVVRQCGRDVEVHAVGASGAPLAEILDSIEDFVLDSATEIATVEEDCAITALAQGGEPTGIRITSADAKKVFVCLRDQFETVHLVR